MTLDAVRQKLLKRAAPYARRRGSSGVRGWCEKNGIAHSHTTEFLNGIRGPTAELLEALGLEWRVMRKERACRTTQSR